MIFVWLVVKLPDTILPTLSTTRVELEGIVVLPCYTEGATFQVNPVGDVVVVVYVWLVELYVRLTLLVVLVFVALVVEFVFEVVFEVLFVVLVVVLVF